MKNEAGKVKASKKARLLKARQIFAQALKEARGADQLPVYLQINIMDMHDWEDVDPASIDQDLINSHEAHYLQAVREASRSVGQFVADLAALPGWQNTFFVITSDHGEGLNNHPAVPKSYRHGNLLYESQARVPLILVNPADPKLKGHVITSLTSLLDLAPTLLDYLKIPAPPAFMGTSLPGLIGLSEPAPDLPEFVVTETNHGKADKIAVYSAEWKYIEKRDQWEGVNEYELQPRGPNENGVLTDKIALHPGQAAKMRSFLLHWERRHPPKSRGVPAQKLTPLELKQLKSLGYL